MANRKPRVTIPTFKTNPFKVEGVETKSRNFNNTEVPAVNTETGEMYALRPIQDISVSVDTKPYVKNFREGLESAMLNLSHTECKIWFYIQLELKPNKEEITLDFHEVKEKFDWANTTGIYEAIRNLISKDFLAKSWKGNTTYWINVNMFFNGDRKKIN